MSLQKTVVIVRPDPEEGPMVSRLPSYLHPVAGRPLIWHAINALMTRERGHRDLLVVTPPDFPAEVLDVGPEPIEIRPLDAASPDLARMISQLGAPVMVAHGSASLDADSLRRLGAAEEGSWIGGAGSQIAAALVTPDQLRRMLQTEDPLAVENGLLAAELALDGPTETFVVCNRMDLARLQGRVRDQLVRALMENGATFLLPESVHVDVDVRIGRDTVVYPGVVIEGQTTVGEETVIGPGCRIIDSWIGSGVEMKGWNYVAHTSVRNRAILEPYVRRGFD